MFASLAVGPVRDIQPIRATLVGTCASATDGASTVPKTTMRKKVTCLGFMITSLGVYLRGLTSKVRGAERAGEARLRDVPLDRNVRTLIGRGVWQTPRQVQKARLAQQPATR